MTAPATKIALRQPEIFLPAMERRSVMRAAQQLLLSAPAVSTQMGKPAEEPGAVFFERVVRSVHPAEAVNEMQTVQGARDARLRVAMVSTAHSGRR